MSIDAIVVLGSTVTKGGHPGSVMRRRVAHAVRAFKSGRAPVLVLSGGMTGKSHTEAEVMARLAHAHGVESDRIVLEDRSRNTFENALYTGRIMRDRGWQRVLVVTDLYHMPRALFIFRRLGLTAEAEPVRRSDHATFWVWYGGWAREALAFTRSAALFVIGRHKARMKAEWGA